jgi:selenide,water dikinase
MFSIPLITNDIIEYISNNAVPGGTHRNWASYGQKVNLGNFGETEKYILADPQTSGGLLISVDPKAMDDLKEILHQYDLSQFDQPIGKIISQQNNAVVLK